MRKKLQVFVSSTFTDLKDERQTAVKAILNAGHIPAGMELFTAGDSSQQEIIKRWIEESDAYMLIVGGRYGSLLPDGTRSYTHWEYDFAGEIGKPRFAFVLSNIAIQKKIELIGFEHVTELVKPQQHKDFRDELLASTLVYPIDDNKDIEIGVFKSLREIELKPELTGWISGKEVPDVTSIMKNNLKLLKENERLKDALSKNKEKLKLSNDSVNGFKFEELKEILESEFIPLSPKFEKELGEKHLSLLHCFTSYEDNFAVGLTNSVRSDDFEIFMFYNVAPRLMKYGLAEKTKVPGVKYDKIQTSKAGFLFLSKFEVSKLKGRA